MSLRRLFFGLSLNVLDLSIRSSLRLSLRLLQRPLFHHLRHLLRIGMVNRRPLPQRPPRLLLQRWHQQLQRRRQQSQLQRRRQQSRLQRRRQQSRRGHRRLQQNPPLSPHLRQRPPQSLRFQLIQTSILRPSLECPVGSSRPRPTWAR